MTRAERLFRLTTLLSTSRAYTTAQLSEKLKVSERTVYRDLAALDRELRLPLTRDERGYRLLETARLRPLNLTALEHALLKVALRNPALRNLAPVRGVLRSLEDKLDAATAHLEETPEALRLAGPTTTGPAAERVVSDLEAAVRARRRVEILYSSLSGGTKKWRGVDPYKLFERDGAWYLVGHCHHNREPRVFRLDRIAGVRGSKRAAEGEGAAGEHFPPPKFDLDQYLKDAWRIVVGREAHAIVLRFNSELAPLILHAQHHPGEKKAELASGAIEYRVTLSSLDEVARWVVGFGRQVEVLQPAALRERVRRIAEGALAGQPSVKS